MLVLFLAVSIASFDLKGVALGSSVGGLKAMPLPPSPYGKRSIRCSNEPDFPPFISISKEEIEVGVVRCVPTEVIGGSSVVASLDLTQGHRAAVRYDFYENKLFRIELYPDLISLRVVEEGLLAKFGPPTKESASVMQTRLGATFPQRILTWTAGNQAVRLTAPDRTTEKMSVFYLDTVASKRIEDAIRIRHNPADAM